MKINIDLEKLNTKFKIGEIVYWLLYNDNGTKRIECSKVVGYFPLIIGDNLNNENNELSLFITEYYVELDEVHSIPESFLYKSYDEANEKMKEHNKKY